VWKLKAEKIDVDNKFILLQKDLYRMNPNLIHLYTVKGTRGKVSFDSQNDKYASKLSSDASPEAYLSLRKLKSAFDNLEVRCDKYASAR
jgi:hypothetical protein